jgi:hypothetical protein
MESREIAGLVLAGFTLLAVFAALLYATRDIRSKRRNSIRGERVRKLRNEERIRAQSRA